MAFKKEHRRLPWEIGACPVRSKVRSCQVVQVLDRDNRSSSRLTGTVCYRPAKVPRHDVKVSLIDCTLPARSTDTEIRPRLTTQID